MGIEKADSSMEAPAARSVAGPVGNGASNLRGRLRLHNRPYVLLVLAMLFWSGNMVIGRAVYMIVPPVTLAFFRWLGAFTIVIGFALPHLRHDWPTIRRTWPMLLLLAILGIAAFNTLVYIGLATTTAINGLLLQSIMPIAIPVFAFILFRTRVTWMQMAGMVISLSGVAIIIARGEPATLLTLSFKFGDLLIFIAVVSYALYSALLHRRPPIHPLSFLCVTFAAGTAVLLPFYLWEHLSGVDLRLDGTTLLAIGYVMVFPSVLAYLFYNRGVELIGVNRAGQFVHLIPVFGSLLAVALLGEGFRGFHALGAALIAAGILLASCSSPD